MVESKTTYEECRRQRLEENMKRMQELNLQKLSLDLKTQIAPKPSPAKPRTPRQRADLSAVRRSVRVSGKPAPNYKEAAMEPLKMPRRAYSYSRRDLSNRIYASHDERYYAIEKAEQLQSSLDADFPSFVKPMLQSHVTGGFWLGLPVHFCKSNLPNHDEYLTLVDVDGNESQTKYLSDKTGLSGGWRGFAIDHELVDGDALVFQLTTPTEFKVYIIRAYDSKIKNEDDKDENEDDEEEDKNNDPKEEDETPPPGRRSKRIKRTSENENEDEDKDPKEEDETPPLGRRSKQIKRTSENKNEDDKDEDENKDPKEEDETPSLGRRSKRIKRTSENQNEDENKDPKEEDETPSLGRRSKRIKRRKE